VAGAQHRQGCDRQLLNTPFAVGFLLPAGQWQLCNHECGNVSASVAARWNAGKAKVVTAVNEFLGNQGPWFANGNAFAGIPSNFHGSWNFDQLLHSGDPRKLVEWVQGEQCMSNHTFCYLSSTSDQVGRALCYPLLARAVAIP